MSGLTRFLGDSPLRVLLKLIVVSFLVGIVMSAFGWSPFDVLYGIRDFFLDIWNMGFRGDRPLPRLFPARRGHRHPGLHRCCGCSATAAEPQANSAATSNRMAWRAASAATSRRIAAADHPAERDAALAEMADHRPVALRAGRRRSAPAGRAGRRHADRRRHCRRRCRAAERAVTARQDARAGARDRRRRRSRRAGRCRGPRRSCAPG